MPLQESDFLGLIQAALSEDIGHGDLTSNLVIPVAQQATMTITAREPLIVAGVGIAARVFDCVDSTLQCTLLMNDGYQADAGMGLLEISGNARSLLMAERTSLNFMGRMCGVATLTSRYVQAVQGTSVRILDTRKTLPGWRMLDKYAVRMGGGHNHRLRLDDGVLIKDNHIAVCGSLTLAIERARAGMAALTVLEVECDTLEQVQEAITAGADMILLDNMTPDQLRQAVSMGNGRVRFEASGNVTLETIKQIALTGIDAISIGRLTHSAPQVDIGMDIQFE
ncbi:MAG: carboxylating nicotinate-nucleotide diphosphorylase [Rickettsiales bacterium]|nr:carboxylating nicotinate-nucleotide diphosphorylase [Rickettsiales bacterium]